MSAAELNNYSIAEVNHHTENRAETAEATAARLFHEDLYNTSPRAAEHSPLILAAQDYSTDAKAIESNVRPDQPTMADHDEVDKFGKAFAEIMLNRGRLEMDSPEGQLLFLGLHQAYSIAGEKGVQQIVDAINKNLNSEFELSIVDDPALTKMIIDEFKSKGKTPPDYIRQIQMKDDKGRDRGGILLLHGPSDKGEGGQPI